MFILRKTLTRVEAYFSIDKYADPYHYEVKVSIIAIWLHMETSYIYIF